jgi:hypothetical protein
MWGVDAGAERTCVALFFTDAFAVRPDLADRLWTSLTDKPLLTGTTVLDSDTLDSLRAHAADHTYRDPHGAVPALALRLAVRTQP